MDVARLVFRVPAKSARRARGLRIRIRRRVSFGSSVLHHFPTYSD